MSRLSYGDTKDDDAELKLISLKHCLDNAVHHGGRASVGAVIGKILAEKPEMRSDVGRVKIEAERCVKTVNFLSPEEQKRRLGQLMPTKKPKKPKKDELPELRNASEGRVVTRFAPAPTGPLNILQVLRALSLSYLYSRKYKGRFVLRFEDTDTSGKIEKEFYGMIRNDIRFLGIKWDSEVIESKNMETFYEHAAMLIKKGDAYVDFTKPEEFRKLKLGKKDPETRNATPEENMKAWQEMLDGKYGEGGAVLRFKTSMKDPNPAVRDPAIFRIAKGSHPLEGNKYKVWPLYNFANVVEDHESGITHVFRGKEHQHNTDIQNRIYDALGWEPPEVVNFGMIYLPGKKQHTRDIKDSIKRGHYSGWDDPRLHTIAALRKRGYQGKAFLEAARMCGLSKSDIRFSIEGLDAANRKIIDPQANRYMVVFEPKKIVLKDYPHKINFVTEPLHPDFPKRGVKRLQIDPKAVYLDAEDMSKLKGKTFRLKGLANFTLRGATGRYAGDELKKSMKKVQWVSGSHIDVKLTVPEEDELAVRKGLGEASMTKLKPESIIQMERIGFARVESLGKDSVNLLWLHK